MHRNYALILIHQSVSIPNRQKAMKCDCLIRREHRDSCRKGVPVIIDLPYIRGLSRHNFWRPNDFIDSSMEMPRLPPRPSRPAPACPPVKRCSTNYSLTAVGTSIIAISPLPSFISLTPFIIRQFIYRCMRPTYATNARKQRLSYISNPTYLKR